MSIKRALQIIAMVYYCTLLTSCKTSLKEGDIIFQDLDSGELSDAIEAVTEGQDGGNFSHCALVVNINDTLKIVEAIGTEVKVSSLEEVFARTKGDTKKTSVGRLTKQYRKLIPKAISRIKALIGEPYDEEFKFNNNKWYCSELIYEAFKNANNQNEFFEAKPMTFKDKKTTQFHPVWVDYFKGLNMEIPEGEAGINPGLISKSDKIEILELTYD